MSYSVIDGLVCVSQNTRWSAPAVQRTCILAVKFGFITSRTQKVR